MKKLSDMTMSVNHSGIRKMFNMTFGMDNIISFAVGEPDFSAPQRVAKAANDANLSGNTKYTPNAGLYPLRAQISKELMQNKCNYNPESEIIVTAGGMEALYMTMLVLLDPGDEVIISDPYWCNYPQQVKMAGGIPVAVGVKEEDGFTFDMQALEAAITPKTKLVILNSPSNPTGAVTSKEKLIKIAELIKKYDLYIISDEVYQHFMYDDHSHTSIASLPEMKERTIIVNSFSKTYAMTGWRVGYAAGPAPIISQMTKLHENISACANTSAQYAALAALAGPEEEIFQMRDIFKRRRDLLVDGLNSIDGLSCIMPAGAFYAFPNITKTGMSSEDFAVKLLKETGTVVIPGTAFGPAGEGFVRLSYATGEAQILEGLKRIETFLKKCYNVKC